MDPLVIVGTGLGGYAVAREFRKLDARRPVVMVSADSGEYYAKPMLSNALAQGKSAAALANASAEAMAAQLDASVRAGTRVLGIDPAARAIETDRGALRYGDLVLALGSEAIRLPLAGDASDRAIAVNDLADYREFRRRLDGRKRVAIMGAGLIGVEFANDLATCGYAVTAIDPAGWPLASLVPEAAGRQLEAALSGLGVDWRLGRAVASVERDADSLQLTLDDRDTIEADVLLSAVGVRPRTALARQAGLAVNQGIVVDSYLRSSDERIFAIGDCAEVDGRVRPHVMPITLAARALAKTLAGAATPVDLPAMPILVKTPACPVAAVPAPRGGAGRWSELPGTGGLRLGFSDADGRLLGFALAGTEAVAARGLWAGRIGQGAAAGRLPFRPGRPASSHRGTSNWP